MIEKILIPAAVLLSFQANAQIENNLEQKKINKEASCYTNSEIREIVKSIVSDVLGILVDDISYNTSFTDDLGADSLDTVELIIDFEKVFNIHIPDDIAENIKLFGEAVDYITNQYINSVSIFSEPNYAGNKRCIKSKTSENELPEKGTIPLIENGVSSIIIPKNLLVTLFSEKDYEGETMIINSIEGRIEITDLNKLNKFRKNKNISRSSKVFNWNDHIKSINVESIK